MDEPVASTRACHHRSEQQLGPQVAAAAGLADGDAVRGHPVHNINPAVAAYLAGVGPHKLEIGAGPRARSGWLTTDLIEKRYTDGSAVFALDVTKDFSIDSNSFDYIYSEHMIEHITFEDGQNMLEECYRILKPGGVIRIATPSIEFIQSVITSKLGSIHHKYKDWAIRVALPEAASRTNAFFFNNFVRAWGHTFIYDQETLHLALGLAGFEQVTNHDLDQSEHPAMRDLANETRMPPGFLRLESMIVEGVKPPETQSSVPTGQNIAYNKKATQSSVCQWSRQKTRELDACGAVNGKLTGSYSFHTDFEEKPWWQVDLGSVFVIEQLRIFNRTAERTLMKRASRFDVLTSDDNKIWTTRFSKTSDTVIHGGQFSPFVWAPDESFSARYLRIQLQGTNFLHLDEVEVFGFDGHSI